MYINLKIPISVLKISFENIKNQQVDFCSLDFSFISQGGIPIDRDTEVVHVKPRTDAKAWLVAKWHNFDVRYDH